MLNAARNSVVVGRYRLDPGSNSVAFRAKRTSDCNPRPALDGLAAVSWQWGELWGFWNTPRKYP